MRVVPPPVATLLFSSLYEFLFTPACCHCGSSLRYGERFLCRPCGDSLCPLESSDLLYQEAFRRLTGDGLFDGLISLFRFEKGSPLQSLLHELKYRGRSGAGLLLGRRLGEAVASAPGIGGFSGCLPVPLHRIRRRERGYNQSSILCRGLAEVSGVPFCGTLVQRVRATPSQTSLGSEARRENMEGAFTCRRGAARRISGRSLLLVDDIMTTGATLRSCGMVLRSAGVRRLVACTAALAS